MSAELPVRPQQVWPFPLSAEQRDLLIAAKAQLDLPYRIQPVMPEPGGPGRVLCFGDMPRTRNAHGQEVEFLCEAVMIDAENVSKPESVLNALRFTLTAPAGAPGSFDEAAQLAVLMPGTREVTDVVELALLEQEIEDRAMRRAMDAAA